MKEIAKILEISVRGIEKQIAKLKKNGKISRIGSSRSGYWKIESKIK